MASSYVLSCSDPSRSLAPDNPSQDLSLTRRHSHIAAAAPKTPSNAPAPTTAGVTAAAPAVTGLDDPPLVDDEAATVTVTVDTTA